MYFLAPCGVVLYFVVCKLYTDKEKINLGPFGPAGSECQYYVLLYL